MTLQGWLRPADAAPSFMSTTAVNPSIWMSMVVSVAVNCHLFAVEVHGQSEVIPLARLLLSCVRRLICSKRYSVL